MKKRLTNCDSLVSKNDEQDDKFHDLINFLDYDSWNIEEAVLPWLAAKEKLREFSTVFLLMNFGTMWKMSCKILATLRRLRFL